MVLTYKITMIDFLNNAIHPPDEIRAFVGHWLDNIKGLLKRAIIRTNLWCNKNVNYASLPGSQR